MLQETNLEKALKRVSQGKIVLAATKKSGSTKTFRPLNEILDKFIFLIDVPAVEEPEFKEAVAQMVQNTPQQEEVPEKESKPAGYDGFLHIRCKCGKEKSFCAKHKLSFYKCNSCQKKTDLKDLKLAFVNCECGGNFRYFTNETAEMFDLNCMECGQPVAVKYNKKKSLYETIRDSGR